jgi:hypothetical protein
LIEDPILSLLITAERYEAEDAIVEEYSIEQVEDENVSGTMYMKEGCLSFTMNAEEDWFYTLRVS